MMEEIFLKFAEYNIFKSILLVFGIYLAFNIVLYLLLKGYDYFFNKKNTAESKIDLDTANLYNNYAMEVSKRILINIENYDKNILTLATFLLGLSLIFIKDIVGDVQPIHMIYIHVSWQYFLVSIAMTVISFIIGVKDNEMSLSHYYKEVVENKKEYGNKINIYSIILKYMTYMSGTFLFLGMLYLYLFVKANF